MAAIDFPATPTLGQEFTAAGITYIWNGQGWLVAPADLGGGAGGFVSKSGDTMSGDLAIHSSSPDLLLNKTASGEANDIMGLLNGLGRWRVTLGDESSETGAGVGSNFVITPYDDGGAPRTPALVINRQTGLITVAGNPTAPLGLVTKQYLESLPQGALLATLAEARAGVDDAKYISPYKHRYSHSPAFSATLTSMPMAVRSWTAAVGWVEVMDSDDCFNGVSFRPTAAGWYKRLHRHRDHSQR
jgi:hypothetical protein